MYTVYISWKLESVGLLIFSARVCSLKENNYKSATLKQESNCHFCNTRQIRKVKTVHIFAKFYDWFLALRLNARLKGKQYTLFESDFMKTSALLLTLHCFSRYKCTMEFILTYPNSSWPHQECDGETKSCRRGRHFKCESTVLYDYVSYELVVYHPDLGWSSNLRRQPANLVSLTL